MSAKLEFFSEAKIALNRETKKHPDLAPLLASYEADDFEGRIAEVAAYCGVLVDGYYDELAIDKLCDILFTKLRAKRAGIVT